MGVEQLVNGSFENIDAQPTPHVANWTSADGEIKTDSPGKDSPKSSPFRFPPVNWSPS